MVRKIVMYPILNSKNKEDKVSFNVTVKLEFDSNTTIEYTHEGRKAVKNTYDVDFDIYQVSQIKVTLRTSRDSGEQVVDVPTPGDNRVDIDTLNILIIRDTLEEVWTIYVI